MYGKAILNLPQSGNIGPSRTEGLSDELALLFGRIAATSLSDEDGLITVLLESGEVRAIGRDTLHEAIVKGRVERGRNYGTV